MAKPQGGKGDGSHRPQLRGGAVVVFTTASHITWTFAEANPAQWQIRGQAYEGAPWSNEDPAAGAQRSHEFDGDTFAAYIFGIDANGNRITQNSNIATH